MSHLSPLADTQNMPVSKDVPTNNMDSKVCHLKRLKSYLVGCFSFILHKCLLLALGADTPIHPHTCIDENRNKG